MLPTPWQSQWKFRGVLTQRRNNFVIWEWRRCKCMKAEGKRILKKKDWRLHNGVDTEACWVNDGLLYSQVIFFRAFYFCLRQTNKQNRPTVDSHERAGASLLQASNSFYSYILHSTSTACCISNKKPSRLTFAAHSLTSPLGCCLPSTFELPLSLPSCLALRFHRAEIFNVCHGFIKTCIFHMSPGGTRPQSPGWPKP